MADDPHDPGFFIRMRKRFLPRQEPEPAPPSHVPQWTPPPDHGAGTEKPRIPSAFYTGQEPRKPRRPSRGKSAEPGRPSRAKRERSEPNRTVRPVFEARSLSARMKREQQFEARFKGEVARAEAREAMEDAAFLRSHAQTEHIERVREWRNDLRFLVSGGKPWSVEAGADINRRGEELDAQFDREMQEIDAEERRALGWAESLDLKEDKRRQRLLGIRPEQRDIRLIGYTPNRPRDFNGPARPPATIIVPPEPGQVITSTEPFNDATTRPPPPSAELEHAFNDAVTAPESRDRLEAWFAQFNQHASPPAPQRPGMAPSR